MNRYLTFEIWTIFVALTVRTMLFDPPIASGANTFIWIVVILIGFVGALSQHDALFKGKKKKEEH
ncbi:hypothetical protein [Roseivirga sp. 4D4]|uniref:hypothetical protein n=1 Tax=Roseivirga sp. 4D4 TaxID=1889784 RepID=UPI000B0D1EE2|nr:hypothetical protein [Roseivirga sp. 4D4]